MNMNQKNVLYEWQKIHDKVKRKINNLSERDRNLLNDYDEQMGLEQLSIARRILVLQRLVTCRQLFLNCDFEDATKDDIRKCLVKTDNYVMPNGKSYSEWTIKTMIKVLRKFYKWVEYKENYLVEHRIPDRVAWLGGLRKKCKPSVKYGDILNIEEIDKIISALPDVKYKAFFTILYQTGARISEIANLKLKDVIPNNDGFLINITISKTLPRTPLVFENLTYISQWLSNHPFKDNPESYLFITTINREKSYGKPMRISCYSNVLKRAQKRIGLKKRLYCHLFRHSRATHLLSKKGITEAAVKKYLGWTPDTKAMRHYSHLADKDANEMIMLAYNRKKIEEVEEEKRLFCIHCGYANEEMNKVCMSCQKPLFNPFFQKKALTQYNQNNVLCELKSDSIFATPYIHDL